MTTILALIAAMSLTVDVEPQRLTPGMPLRVMIRGVEAQSVVSGEFLGQPVHFLPGPEPAERFAFAGADLLTKPGVHPLTVRLEGANGKVLFRRVEIGVDPKDYPTEQLQVNKEYVDPPPDVQKRIARESKMLKAIWASTTPGRLFDGAVNRPLPGVEGRNFGRRRIFNGKPRSPHSGVDLSAPAGTVVGAAARGRVVVAEELYFSGNLVVLDHGGDVYTLYAHLSKIDVVAGEEVAAGAPVGRVGATGRVTGAHLHWGARIGQARVDPSSLLDLLSF